MKTLVLLQQVQLAFQRKAWKTVIAVATELLQVTEDPQAFVFRGQAYFQLKEFSKAVPDLERAIGVHSTSQQLRFYAAQANVRCGRIGSGIAHLERALEYHPDSVLLWRTLISIAEKTGLVGVLAQAQEKLLEVAPEDAELACSLLCRYVQVAMNSRAIALLPQAKKVVSPQAKKFLLETLIRENYVGEAKEILQENTPKDLALSWSAFIQKHIQVGALEQAEHWISQSLSEPDARVWAATLASWRGHYDDSLELLREQPPELRTVRIIRASIALQTEQWSDAIAQTQMLLAEDGDDKEAWVILGEAQRRSGQSEQATESLREAQVQSDQINISARINSLILELSDADAKHPVPLWEILDILQLIQHACPSMILPSKQYILGKDAMLLANELDAFLRRMKGNRSDIATWVDEDSDLQVLPRYRNIRSRCAGISPGLLLFSVQDVLGAYANIERQHGEHPLIDTYRAELRLWAGEFAAAEQGLRRVLEKSKRVRWAYNGLAIALSLQGDSEAGLDVLVESRQYFSPLTASLIYETELLYRVGEVTEAREKSYAAIAAHPSRISAWLLSAICELTFQQQESAHQKMQQVQHLCPQFWHQLQMETAGRNELERLLYGLQMMRGNRSSQVLTWHTRDGRMWWHRLPQSG